ncbi:MAG: hypothetical protein CMJ49_09410 [Planctomycetaceae bacterium]|nr:hypothetical protein [Planctomycetaceae bacterium]
MRAAVTCGVIVLCTMHLAGDTGRDREAAEEVNTGAIRSVSHRSVRVQGVAQYVAPIPNARLQLPVVSPDGIWVACQQRQIESPQPAIDSLMTGRGLEAVSLWFQSTVDPSFPPRRVADRGACWAKWSPNNKTLLFVAYDEDDNCTIRLHDVAANETRRLGTGMRRMMMPAMHVASDRVAVVGFDDAPATARVYVVDLKTRDVMPAPRQSTNSTQSRPLWLTDGSMYFLSLDGERGASLMHWKPGQREARPVRTIHEKETTLYDSMIMFHGVPRPLSPGEQQLMYFDLAQRRFRTLPIKASGDTPLQSGYAVAMWHGAGHVLAGRETSLDLIQLPNDASDGPDAPRRTRVLDATWAPVWSDPVGQQAMLVGRTPDPNRFNLVRMYLISGQ